MEFSDSVWSAALVLLFIMDPLGNIPLFLSLLRDVDEKRRRWVLARELLIALGVLFAFLLGGQAILDVLHLQQESVTIAGGLVLLVIGLRMVFPTPDGVMGPQPDGEPFIVPLAIPLIAGPSVLATLILMVNADPGRTGTWALALLMAWGATAAFLMAAPLLYRLLRERGLVALERLMGMLLLMIAVQMLVNGMKTVL
ncbi:MAG: MarC family protein [Bacteroidota bacterium]